MISSYKVDIYILDKQLVYLGILNQYKGVIFPKTMKAYSMFELYAPITEENKTLLQDGNIIYIDEDTAGIIENVKKSQNQSGEKIFNVKGRTMEYILTTRIVWGVYSATNKRPDTMMQDLVKQNCITPTNTLREIPQFECNDQDNTCYIETVNSYQKTGGEVYDAVQGLADTYSLGFKIKTDTINKKYIYEVIYGTDRTESQDVVAPVIFDTDLQEVLDSEYTRISTDLKNVAFVQGQEDSETKERKSVVSGDDTLSGFERRELYVDARDVTNTTTDGTETVTISDSEYENLLVNRGNEKLADYIVTESFEMNINVANDLFMYGVDYFIGDKVTVIDNEIGVKADAILTGIQRTWNGDEFKLSHTFGFTNMSLIRKVKRLIN